MQKNFMVGNFLSKSLLGCYFERSLFDYMDHDNCSLTFFKALLNIIGGKGAISNINYCYSLHTDSLTAWIKSLPSCPNAIFPLSRTKTRT